MKRRKAYVRTLQVAASPCPSCHRILSGTTGVQFDSRLPNLLRLKNNLSMCAYCGALLIFADNDGRLRVMTEAERDSLELGPDQQRLFDMIREKARKDAEALTKRSYN
jgi:hypothetical protein